MNGTELPFKLIDLSKCLPETLIQLKYYVDDWPASDQELLIVYSPTVTAEMIAELAAKKLGARAVIESILCKNGLSNEKIKSMVLRIFREYSLDDREFDAALFFCDAVQRPKKRRRFLILSLITPVVCRVLPSDRHINYGVHIL